MENNPILLQKQVRDNARDLQEFYKELNEWGEKIKKREAMEQKKPKKKPISEAEVAANEKRFNAEVEKLFQPSTSKNLDVFESSKQSKNKRIKGTDYAAWDRFDVDAHIRKLDKRDAGEPMSDDPESEEDENPEVNSRLMELADVDKERGNRYVKSGDWDEAVKCYTRAIDCYPYNAIYYANRALCYLKKNSFRLAETDCTRAIQIDKTYVKAYLRRAAAREKLKYYSEALVDLKKVFEFEPYNLEGKGMLKRIEKLAGIKLEEVNDKPKVLGDVVEKTEPKQKKFVEEKKSEVIERMDIDDEKFTPENSFIYGPGGDKIILIEPIRKGPKMRSKTPLKRVRIETVNLKSEHSVLFKDKMPIETIEPIGKEQHEEMELTSKFNLSEVLDVKLEREIENLSRVKLDLNESNNKVSSSVEKPKTSLLFYQKWNDFKTDSEKYNYLKKFEPSWFRDVFKYNMEMNLFGEILEILNNYFVPNDDNVYDILMGLAKVNRFGALIMFMTEKDQQCMQNIVEGMTKNNKYTEDEILYVKTAYEVKN